MRTYRLINTNIKHYLIESEVLQFLLSDVKLKPVYDKISAVSLGCYVTLVDLQNEISHAYNLNVIIKYEKKSRYGHYEYILVEDFVNQQTNLYKLLETLAISPGISPQDFVSDISTQLTEAGVSINQEYILRKEDKAKNIYFEKTFRDVALN